MYYCVPISISNSTINLGNDFESDSVNRSVGDLFTAVHPLQSCLSIMIDNNADDNDHINIVANDSC